MSFKTKFIVKNIPNFVQMKRNLYYKHKYDPKIEEIINKQIEAEQQAAQNYLSLAVAFLHPGISYPGAGGFFMRQYKEELEHMENFVQYQLLRGGLPVISGLIAPNKIENVTLLDAFNRALCMEKEITELLENLVNEAENVKDYQCADFVTSVFLMEQIRSTNKLAHHVTKLSQLCNYEHALFHYDLHLAKCYPYSYKTPELKSN